MADRWTERPSPPELEVSEEADPAARGGPGEARHRGRAALEGFDEPTETLGAFMGSVTRRGPWEPPARLRVFATWGTVNLDYREADLAFDVNDLTVLSCMGSVTITVPPDIDVEVDSSALLGSVAHGTARPRRLPRAVRRLLGAEPAPREDDSGLPPPLLRIRAVALMGSISIRVR